jgi:LysR family pca operon transcriptional activator
MNLDTRIKFRHLLCFLEIARQGSLARAADVLAISQPAISKTLKELEDLLEARLFERTHLGVDLTPAGTRFMRYAGPSVQALRDGVGSVRGEARTPSQVRIGVLSTVEGLLMPEVLCRLHQRHEALVISVVTGVSAQLLGQLRLGELELVVGRMTDSPQIQGLSFEHLYSESMAWWCARATRCWPARRWSGRRWGLPLVLPPQGTTIRQHADSLFVQCGIQMPAQRLETLSLALSRRYLLGSDALWVAPRDAVLLDLRRNELVELDLGVREPGGSVGICRNAALPPSLPAQWVCEVLREVAGQYRDGLYP